MPFHVDLWMTWGQSESSSRSACASANGGQRWLLSTENGRYWPRRRLSALTSPLLGLRLTLLPGRKPGRSGGRDSGAEGRPNARETWTKVPRGGRKGSVSLAGHQPHRALNRLHRHEVGPNTSAIVEGTCPMLLPASWCGQQSAGRESANAERWDRHEQHTVHRKFGTRNDGSRPPYRVHQVWEDRLHEGNERPTWPCEGLWVRRDGGQGVSAGGDGIVARQGVERANDGHRPRRPQEP